VRERALNRKHRHVSKSPRSSPCGSAEDDPELKLIAMEAENRSLAENNGSGK